MEGAVSAVCRRHGLSHAAVNALAVIEGAASPVLTGEVANRMHITSGTVTALLDNLERKGYVVRSSDADDRRRVLVDITPEAQAVLDAAMPEIQQAAGAIFDGIGSARQRLLLELLDEVRAHVLDLPDELPPPEPRRRPDSLTR